MLCFIFSLLMEFLQIFTPVRNFDFYDLGANFFGVFTTTLIILRSKKMKELLTKYQD